MSERRSQIYIAGDLLHSLILLANARKLPADCLQQRVTAEDVAEEILRGHIKQHYPQLEAHRKAVALMERETIKSLSK